MPLLAHTADLHFGSGRNLPVSICPYLTRTIKATDRLLESFQEQKVEGILVVGDIFHTKQPTPAEIGAFVRWLVKLDDLGIPSIIVPGNHDIVTLDYTVVCCFSDLSSKLQNVSLVTQPKLIKFLGLNVAAIPGHKNSELNTIDKTKVDILVYHGAVIGAKFDNGIICEAGTNPDSLKDFPFVALGDIHKRQRIGTNSVYPGSPYQTRFSELELNRGYVTVNYKKGNPPKIKKIDIKQDYPLVEVIATTQEELNSKAKQIETNQFIHLKLTDQLDLSEVPNIAKLTLLSNTYDEEDETVVQDLDNNIDMSVDPLAGFDDMLKLGGYTDLDNKFLTELRDEAQRIIRTVDSN